MPRKTCKICSEDKTGNHSSYCNQCYNQYKREWYAKNREKEIARCAEYNKKNPEKPRESMQRCRDARPEFYLAYTRNYRKENPEKAYIWSTKNNAIRRAAIAGSKGVSAKEWREIKERYCGRCVYCGIKPKVIQMDHVVPLSRGGLHEPENVVPACGPCNGSKNAKDEIHFRQSKGGLI